MILTQNFSRVIVSSAEPDIEMSRDFGFEIRATMNDLKEEFGGDLTGGGEPQILLNTRTHEIWICSGDWHEGDVIKAVYENLKQIKGATKVDGESESYPEGYHYGQGKLEWEEVYPKKPRWMRK